MEFFDKLTKKASQTYKGAAEKTGKIAKEAKLKMKIGENKSKIKSLYEEIGKKVYQKHAVDEIKEIEDIIKEECEKIDLLSAEIDSYHEEILNLSDTKTCIDCKETIDKSANFCPRCGKEQPQIEEKEEAKEVEVLEQEEVKKETKKASKTNKEKKVVETEKVEEKAKPEKKKKTNKK